MKIENTFARSLWIIQSPKIGEHATHSVLVHFNLLSCSICLGWGTSTQSIAQNHKLQITDISAKDKTSNIFTSKATAALIFEQLHLLPIVVSICYLL